MASTSAPQRSQNSQASQPDDLAAQVSACTEAARAADAHHATAMAQLFHVEQQLRTQASMSEAQWRYQDAKGTWHGPYSLAQLMDFLRGYEQTHIWHANGTSSQLHAELAKQAGYSEYKQKWQAKQVVDKDLEEKLVTVGLCWWQHVLHLQYRL